MPVKDISCQMGALTADGMTAVILSVSNDPATLTVEGDPNSPYIVDMTVQFGPDRNANGAGTDINGDTHVCFVGTQLVAGLEPLTKYDWNLVQGLRVDSGFQWVSTTAKTAKVAVAASTCFNLTVGTEITGWSFLRHYIDQPENPPLLSLLHSDDICYADGAFSGINANASNSQGKEFTNGIIITGTTFTYTQYDYALYYASWFGILDAFFTVADTGKTNPLMSEPLNDDMQYVRSRLAFMPQAGDHEYSNNLGWGTGALNEYPNAYHHTGINDGVGDAVTDGNYDGRGLLTYKACMEPLHGSNVGFTDVNAMHWFADFGSFRCIAMDATTNAVDGIRVHGAAQIADTLNLIDGSQWWHGILQPKGGARDEGDGYPEYTTYAEATFPLANIRYKNESFVQSEYEQMWLETGNTPPSLMDNPFSNGLMGASFMMRGDWHQPLWCYWSAAASAGIHAESINEIGLGALGATAYVGNFFHGSERDSKMLEDDCTLVGALTNLESSPTTQKPNYPIVTIIEIDGEKTTPEITIKQWSVDTPIVTRVSEKLYFTNQNLETITDAAGNIWRCIAERKFVRHDGNQGKTSDDLNVFQYTSTSVGGGE